MDTMTAFAVGQANKDNESKVFDWDKAARIIKDTGATHASAGLQGDWEYTGGSIFEKGKPLSSEDTCVFLSSTWATPELEIDGTVQDCYAMQSEVPNWDSDTFWPTSALKILEEA